MCIRDSTYCGRMEGNNLQVRFSHSQPKALNKRLQMCIRDRDWARATMSFELVDQHNNASKIVDGHNSGIRLYQGKDNKWYIALEATDEGRDVYKRQGTGTVWH